MKNVHIIPTIQPSRLWVNNLYRRLELEAGNLIGSNTARHLYITNDEEVKKEDWTIWLGKDNQPFLKKVIDEREGEWLLSSTYDMWVKKDKPKKIILTTDSDLVKESVQAIDDKFLQWFCNNSSCEEVETYSLGIQNAETGESGHYKYEIIIPKEEFKQECEYCRQAINKYGCACAKPLKDFKQETLEDFIKSYVDKLDRSEDGLVEQCLKDDANWQAKKSYSEEDLIQLLSFVSKEYNISNGIGYFHTHESFEDVSSKEVVQKWFETLKKNNL